MKKRSSLVLAIVYFMLAGFIAKNDDLKIWTQRTTVNKIIAFEKSMNNEPEAVSIKISLSESIYPLINKYEMAKPIIVQRKQGGFLPLHAEYFFSKSDSVIRFISYDWEREKYGNFFKKQEMWKEESGKLNAYNAEYEKIKSALVAKLGKPIAQDAEPQTIKSTAGRGDYLSRKTIWDSDEHHSELIMIFESMTYRIRWNYYWKN